MHDSWIDPGSLEGDALVRWYQRSPAEIEQERQAAAARRYQDFFYGRTHSDPDLRLDRAAPAPNRNATIDSAASVPSMSQDVDPGFTWVPAGPNRWRSVKIEENGPRLHATSHGLTSYGGPAAALSRQYPTAVEPPSSAAITQGHHVQVAATSPGFWDYWSPRGCANCHGYTPGTLPPVGGHSPLPPGYSPRSGGANGPGGSSQPDRRDKKECDLQYDSDSQICGRLPSPRDVAICRESASRRYAHCLTPDGTIGFPPLETKGGRRR
jgi:hypothetical protein